MEKKKETPWTTQKIMFKNGNQDVFRKFTWLTWKNMTEGERAMWTELSEIARAPIPKETIEFEKTVKAANKPKGKVLIPDVFDDEDIDKEAFEPKATLKLSELDGVRVPAKEKPFTHLPVSEIDRLRAELKERGIKFAYNSKLTTLQKKLADADNPE